MKPTKTWILLANGRKARVLMHNGPGRGLHADSALELDADEPVENSDEPGVGRSIAGPGVNAVEQTDPKEQADRAFARKISEFLSDAVRDGRIDRIILVAAPHMLGLLRKVIAGDVSRRVTEEIPKDLVALPIDQVSRQLADVIAI